MLNYLNYTFPDNLTPLKVEINTDGVCYSDNAKSTFWPVSIAIPGITRHPIIIACYHGANKPSSVNDIFDQFVTEFSTLQEIGFEYKNKQIFLSLEGN